MSLYFQSICSSSAGNCLALWSDSTRLLIDCGLSSMKRTRAALNGVFGHPSQIDAVLLTHTHSDHISHYPLRVLDEYGVTVHLHDDCVDQLVDKHYKGLDLRNLQLAGFQQDGFTVGDFRIQPFEVPHHPNYPTYGYQIFFQDIKLVIATDFLTWEPVFDAFVDADFVFVESNHDLELLRRYYNPNSRYHLPNPSTADLLVNLCRMNPRPSRRVILGHLSDQRNDPETALKETTDAFQKAGVAMDFTLAVAPLREPGDVMHLN